MIRNDEITSFATLDGKRQRCYVTAARGGRSDISFHRIADAKLEPVGATVDGRHDFSVGTSTGKLVLSFLQNELTGMTVLHRNLDPPVLIDVDSFSVAPLPDEIFALPSEDCVRRQTQTSADLYVLSSTAYY